MLSMNTNITFNIYSRRYASPLRQAPMWVCQGHRCHNVAAGLPVALYGIGDSNNVVSLGNLNLNKGKSNDEEVLTCVARG